MGQRREDKSTSGGGSSGAGGGSAGGLTGTGSDNVGSKSGPAGNQDRSSSKILLNDDFNEELHGRYRDLCSDLNLDRKAADEAWNSFVRIGATYTLEGNKLHWLACSLYVACRRGVTPTVGRSMYLEGNCVSVPRLLRSCKLSLVEFFNKMRKWADMVNLSAEMRTKIEQLENNFNVTTVIYKKYKPIFEDIFLVPATNGAASSDPTQLTASLVDGSAGTSGTGTAATSRTANKRAKAKAKQNQTTSVEEISKFCWTLYVLVKSHFAKLNDDLVNSYHLLLVCIEFCYMNALVSENARELLNPKFSGLPENFTSDDFQALEQPKPILEVLCKECDGLSVEAKCIKEHWWKPYIKRLYDKKILRCRPAGTSYATSGLIGFFDLCNFENNLKSITKEYDAYVLNIGDFDERVFLSERAKEEIGTLNTYNTGSGSILGNKFGASPSRSSEQQLMDRHVENVSLVPRTPMSSRYYQPDVFNLPLLTPISSATQCVGRLLTLLENRRDKPSAELLAMFALCDPNPAEKITERVREMTKCFVEEYSKPLQGDEMSDPLMSIGVGGERNSTEFSEKRAQLAVTLFYKLLEKLLDKERKRVSAADFPNHLNAVLVSNKIFPVSLFAACVEIVLFSYNAKRTFPWVVDIFSGVDQFTLKPFHFYRVIELIIREEEALPRDVVKHFNTLEEQILESMAWKSDSPLWELIRERGGVVPTASEVAPPKESPTTPAKPGIRRNLFSSGGDSVNASPVRQVQPQVVQQPQLVQIQVPIQTESGETHYMMMNAYAMTGGTTSLPQAVPLGNSNNNTPNKQEPVKPKLDALGLFMRKVFYLANIRMRDLWDRIGLTDQEDRRKVWTLFENVIRHHTELMRDRHIDQMIMCSIYAMCRVLQREQSFTDIMNKYRLQPQAKSTVYRSVLITPRRRRDSSGSNASRNSGSNSPVLEDGMRSSSALPIPQPTSQPPTPTKLAGCGTTFDFPPEERGDLIYFYNKIFVTRTKSFVYKFDPNKARDTPVLAPLPSTRASALSPRRQLGGHSVFVSPLKSTNKFPPSPSRPMSYSFQRSPAKDLRAINQMMRISTTTSSSSSGLQHHYGRTGTGQQSLPLSNGVSKRLALEEVDSVDNSPSPSKRLRTMAIGSAAGSASVGTTPTKLFSMIREQATLLQQASQVIQPPVNGGPTNVNAPS